MSSLENFKALGDLVETSHVQIHVAGDFYNGPITNSAVGGRENSVIVKNVESKTILEELRRVSGMLMKQNSQSDTVEEGSLGSQWTKFRDWLKEDEANLSFMEEVPGTLSLQEMPRVEKAIKTLESDFIPTAASAESKVYNLKMLGDCYRYQAQFGLGASKSERENIALKAWEAYTEASRIAVTALAPTHAIRLGVSMSFALYNYDILNCPERACYIAHKARTDYFSALGKDELIEVDTHKELAIVQRLVFNVTLWASDMQDETEKDDAE